LVTKRTLLHAASISTTTSMLSTGARMHKTY